MADIATTADNTFEGRLFQKIRSEIGDLMTNDELKVIVDKAMHKAFFEERIEGAPWNERKKPSVFVEMIREIVEVRVKDAIQEWIKNHPEEIKGAVNDCLGESFLKIVSRYLQVQMQDPLMIFESALKNKGIL